MLSPKDVTRLLESDFKDNVHDEKQISQEDIQFVDLMNNRIHKTGDGHYEMPLPFKSSKPTLPDNRKLAAVRLNHLKRKLVGNQRYQADYQRFMKDIIDKGDAELATPAADEGRQWYIPHHGVYHPKKPDKLRVVFDCSARYGGQSLNDHLLTGPDLTNGLTGVLCRFRKHPIAVICDIERMFHQFLVNEEDRNYLRFLWWENGDMETEPSEYRMKVHLFGAASSPGCANYGLKYLARENKSEFPLASAFIERDFYVDDGLTSVETEMEAERLVKESQDLCARGGLRLHKFISNNKTVMESIPVSERATGVKDLSMENLPIERALGVEWCVENDNFRFRIAPEDRSPTRRSILSIVASVFDPLGFLAPFVLTGKRILQEMCRKGVGWDEPPPSELLPRWEQWIRDFANLKEIQIRRCFKPRDFGEPTTAELHHFSDASMNGYGQCTYLRLKKEDQVHCTLVMSKARVAPTKVITIPRLELTAAVTSVAVSAMLKRDLDCDINKEYFWTDSQVVLGYISNEARRFHVFVANRVQRIRDSTQPSQWHYVDTEVNPADYASRGLSASEIQNSTWLTGPRFLWEEEITASNVGNAGLAVGDPEVRGAMVLSTSHETSDMFGRFSRWTTLVSVVCRILRMPKREKGKNRTPVEQRRRAEHAIVRAVQQEAFEAEIRTLGKGTLTLSRTSKLHQLDPFLQDGVLRVGGRLRKASMPDDVKHPIILPKDSHATHLILSYFHYKTQHQGRGMTLNELRANGYWVLGGSKTVAKLIRQCVKCRKLRRPTEEQRMADLPEDRVEEYPAFTYCGMDCFGPFITKLGRKEYKRYGLLFTCFCSRGIHIEMLDDMTTDAFINALRCFIAIRGAVRQIRSDQGSNFVGARNEFKEALKEVDIERVAVYLAEKQCDFCLNAPSSSHVGGVWERQIRTVRSVLNATLSLCPGRLDDSSLRAFLYEAMSLVNSRPLTVKNIDDPTSLEPLTPNHLITMKSTTALPPPGKFIKEDMYARKRWRRVQYLAEQFWSRWKGEYLANISTRQKWHGHKRNIQVGDIVLVKDADLPRNEWPLARVLETVKSDDGLVRRVRIQVGDRRTRQFKQKGDKPSVLERPVQKLVLLVESR